MPSLLSVYPRVLFTPYFGRSFNVFFTQQHEWIDIGIRSLHGG